MRTDDQIIADIVIGGGGLVGLSLGLALAKSGLEIVVVDNQDPATMRKEKFDGRVCSISYGSMRVLDGIGLWDSLQGEAEPYWIFVYQTKIHHFFYILIIGK